MTETLLAVFAKHWTPGGVKTRLAASVGETQAANYYRDFLATTLRRFEAVADVRAVVFTPEARREEFAALSGQSWQLIPQADGDLGQRLAAFLAAALLKIARRVVILGADSPTLPFEYVQEAFGRLDSNPVVLGPSGDGGYYLLGVSGAVPPIFDHMPWSEPALLAATLERLAANGIAAHQLPPWYDIDDADDLKRYLAEHHTQT
ncbi:MAG: TIGR04282 family arsenosugar biosynthesis glycosyltransferase [Pirellulales bacterium]